MSDQVYSRKNPFPAHLLVHRKLSKEGSIKDTHHFEIGLSGSGLEYEVGDSVGVFPENDPEYVEELLECLGCDGEEAVPTPAGEETSLRQALQKSYAITAPPRKFMADFAVRANDFYLQKLMEKDMAKDFQKYLEGREIVDLFEQFPDVKYEPEEFVGLLGKLNPRLYSIASSLKMHPEEVHLTIERVEYETHGRNRKGVCSTYLADRVHEGEKVPVFVHHAKNFKLPDEGDVPIIMVGPGTGIAPFRASLEERKARGAKGKNWLFFGSPHAKTDFLYGDEFTQYQEEGLLTKLNTAFSRDQDHKIYVQHRIQENAGEIWDWINDGAIFYVCGDAIRMAKDVDAALHALIAEHGGMSEDEAAEYVKQMKKDKRYQRDVY